MTAPKRTSEDRSPAERRAAGLLRQAGVLRGHRPCPSCGGSGRKLAHGRFRCSMCGRGWSERTKTAFDGLPLSCQTISALIRFYAAGIPHGDAAGRLGLEDAPVQEAYARIRSAATWQEEEKEKNLIPGNGENLYPRKTVAFGIRFKNGVLRIEKVPAAILFMPGAIRVPPMQRGNILFITMAKGQYQGFIMFEPDRNGQEFIRLTERNSPAWSPLAGFWQFAAEAWASRRGMARQEIPDFLQDLVFRFNYRLLDPEVAILVRLAEWTRKQGMNGAGNGLFTTGQHIPVSGQTVRIQ